MNLRDKVALITGGTRMGAAVAQALADKSCSIVLTWRHSRQAVESIARQLENQGHLASSFPCDLLKPGLIRQVIRKIEKRFGRLDVIVNLASIYRPTRLSKDDPSRSWDENLSANAKSAYLLSIEAAGLMRRSGGGRIIHVSDWTSASGRPRYRDYSPYYISKSAVQAVVETLALEFAPDILVNGIAPGPMVPPPSLGRKEVQSVMKSTPLRRWGGAGEIAKAVMFLAETDFVTGEILRVDGGRHLY
jgi:NAD(P)-dependent dehydrogenase (short-subunit alcohol dehydrogenase family)